MKNNIPLVFILIISFSACDYYNISSYNTSSHIYISEYPEERQAAVSFTFDDNCPSGLSKIAPLLEKYGFKATFFVIPNQVGNTQWPKWKNLSDKGFEIGNHTFNHYDLTLISDSATLQLEINRAYKMITDKIGKAPFSFAHPKHVTNKVVDQIVFQKHYATRITPEGFCNWWGVTSSSDVAMFEKDIREAIKKNEWLVVVAHGVDDCWQPMKSHFLEQCLAVTKSKESQIWIDHFGNLSKYKIEKQNTSVKIKESEGKLNITLESQLDTTIFNYPLTVVIDDPRYKRANVTPKEGTSIVNLTHFNDKIILKLLPKSKIQLQVP